MTFSVIAPGFGFRPTDVELVEFYLKRKVMGKDYSQAISEIDLYSFHPSELPKRSFLQSKDEIWYFFCRQDQKYANCSRRNRSNRFGCWKITGKDKSICHKKKVVGMKTILIFRLAKAQSGVARTNWVMHEYRLIEHPPNSRRSMSAYVVCKVFKKTTTGPTIDEQNGAPFREEEWENKKLQIPDGFPTVLQPGTAANGHWCSPWGFSDVESKGDNSEPPIFSGASETTEGLQEEELDASETTEGLQEEELGASEMTEGLQEEELVPIDKYCFATNVASDFDDACDFIEMKDLQDPLEDGDFEVATSSSLLGHASIHGNFENSGICTSMLYATIDDFGQAWLNNYALIRLNNISKDNFTVIVEVCYFSSVEPFPCLSKLTLIYKHLDYSSDTQIEI